MVASHLMDRHDIGRQHFCYCFSNRKNRLASVGVIVIVLLPFNVTMESVTGFQATGGVKTAADSRRNATEDVGQDKLKAWPPVHARFMPGVGNGMTLP